LKNSRKNRVRRRRGSDSDSDSKPDLKSQKFFGSFFQKRTSLPSPKEQLQKNKQ
jgi:hypothetical protein